MTDIDTALREAFSLSGKTALVTGAGSGVAATIAATLALAGATVVAPPLSGVVWSRTTN